MTDEKKSLMVKEIFEKIKPNLLKRADEDILKVVTVHSYLIFIDTKNSNAQQYFMILKEELENQCGISIGNNLIGAIPLNFEEKDE